VTQREQALVFGEVAADYERARSGYRVPLREAVLDYAGPVGSILEVGAGTGLASELFAPLCVPMTCVEPDPAMAAVLAGKLAAFPHVRVVAGRFEDHRPDAPVDLLFSAQAWHWVDPDSRASLAFAALREGGTFALFGHSYQVADAGLRERLRGTYRRLAPELLGADDDEEDFTAFARSVGSQMSAGGLFGQPRVLAFGDEVDYPAERYLRLLGTFSNHRMLDARRLADLAGAVAADLAAHGGTVRVRLGTGLGLLRRLGG
jgi:SAM-dependent methyltransferase